MKTCRALPLGMLLAAAVALAAVPEDFVQRLLAAGQLYRQGDYAGAETILLAARAEADRFGPDDPRQAILFNNLGSVYHSMNRYRQAEQCYRRAVEIEGRVWGATDDRPIRSILNLAALYIETGQYGKVERLGLRSLSERQATSRRDHPDYARLSALLSDFERRQGSHAKAQQYGEEALAIFDRVAPNGNAIVETLNNLCVLYGESGRNREALSCCERAVKIAEETGNLEPSVQASLFANLGTFQFLVHGPAAAEPFYRKALGVAESVLSQGHPLSGQILLSYAVVLERTSRKTEADQCRRRAKAILETARTEDQSKYTIDLADLLRKGSSR